MFCDIISIIALKYVRKDVKMMSQYKNVYLHLFNAVTDAILALQERNYGLAEQSLIRAQQEAEERILSDEE